MSCYSSTAPSLTPWITTVSICHSIYLFTYLFIYLSTYLSVYLSFNLSSSALLEQYYYYAFLFFLSFQYSISRMYCIIISLPQLQLQPICCYFTSYLITHNTALIFISYFLFLFFYALLLHLSIIT